MIVKAVVRSLCCVLFFNLASCTLLKVVANMDAIDKMKEASSYDKNSEYDKAILAYTSGLELSDGSIPFLDFVMCNQLGVDYAILGNLEKASEYFKKSIEVMPERSYSSYLNLAGIEYRQGNLEGAYENISRAKAYVDSPRYQQLPKLPGFSNESMRRVIHSGYDFYELRFRDSQLNEQLKLKHYDNVMELAQNIFNNKYHVWVGLRPSTIIHFVEQGSIADLSGAVAGDKILEFNGLPLKDDSDFVKYADQILSILDNYGDTVEVKVDRKGRILTINCKLVYPEVEKARTIYNATRALAANKAAGKDTQSSSLAILERESAASGNIVAPKIPIANKVSAWNQFDKIYANRVAVVIGINKYNPWPSLEFAVNDAKSMRVKLADQGFDKIIELYDRTATRARIMRILADELPSTMGPNDALMVYFAGHGATEELADGSQEGYIIPVDGDVENFRGTSISMTYIHEMIKKYRAKHILFAFDSCYSGLGLKRGRGAIGTASGFIQAMAQKSVVQIITAGGKGEQAGEEKGHGIFTEALLDALDGKDGLSKDGYILASDIGQKIRKKVGEKTNFTQTPLFGWLAGEGDFIFAGPITSLGDSDQRGAGSYR